jgi:hypothetical protein
MSQPDLQWKDIPIEPFNTSYVISNYGDIKNKKTQKIKAFQISSTGYKSVKLDTKANKKTIDIHVYVAKAFLTPIQEKDNFKMVVCFKDGNRQNTYYKNLEYGYQKDKNNVTMQQPQVQQQPPQVQQQPPQVQQQPLENNTEITIGNFTGKPIKDYEKYLISKTGEIYCIKTNKNKVIDKELTGYCRIRLFNDINKQGKNFYVHQLVAKTYIPNPNNYDKINHKDFNKHNNTTDNLEWCTDSMNMIHNAVNKPETSKKVKQINKDTDEVIKVFDSIKDAAISTGSNNTSIIHCCSGKYNTANGYKWTYA